MASNELLQALIETNLAGSAAILLVLALRRPLRRAFGACVAYAAWALVPLAMLAVLLPAASAPTSMAMPALAVLAPVDAVAEVSAGRAMPDAWTWVATIWALGVFASLAWMAVQQRRFLRGLGGLADRGDDVLVTDAAVAGLPAVVGLWRPRIVLPADVQQRYDATERALMLAHERTHVARGDLFANALVAGLRCLCWFNPLLHAAARRFRDDQELACDQQVVRRHPEARRAYGEAMLKTQLAGDLLPLGCHWGQTHPIRERIEMLRQPLPTRRRRTLGSAIAVVLSLSVGYAAWAAQPAATLQSASVLPGAEDSDYTARVEFSQDGGEPARFVAGKKFGESFTMVDGDAAGHPAVTATIVPMLHEGKLAFDIAMRIEQDGKLVSTPRLLVLDGNTAVVREGSERDGRFEGIELEVTVSARDAAAALQHAEAASGRQAQLIATQPPKYPKEALDADAGGKVVLLIDVAADGTVANVEVESSTGDERFAAAASKAAMKWRFNPKTEDGKPVAGRVRVPVTFTPDEPKPSPQDG